MLPRTLALVDDDGDYARSLSGHLGAKGIDVKVFGDSNELLASREAFNFDFYLLDLMLPGVDGAELIKVLRLRTAASVLVVSGRLGADVFRQVVDAGADMYLTKPVQFEQVSLAIRAMQRRAAPVERVSKPWQLDRRAGCLVAPDGTRVELSAADVLLLERFLEAGGEVVPRQALLGCLGHGHDPSPTDGLNATIYRLRRRIEKATAITAPLHAKSGIGYVFKAPLSAM